MKKGKNKMEETLKEYDVVTEYHKTFKAHSHEEAQEMAYQELCNMTGLDNDWSWSEYCQSMDLTNL